MDGETVKAGQAIVNVLKAEGVRFVFGLPGGHTLGIYDALYDTPEIRHVLVRHEQAAGSMAAGYAQLTGEPGVCLVTAGPGATNLVTSIAEAYVGSLPIVVLAARAAAVVSHRGASQEVSTEQLFAPITKWSVRVDRADLLVEIVRRAFAIARNGKPGPVYVDIPRDLLNESVPLRAYSSAGPRARPRAEMSKVAAAAELLAGGQRPIIIAGGGTVASGAFAELRELAELLAAPVLTSLAGRGSIPDDHPLSVGGLGAHRNPLSKRLLHEADVVLGLGTRFEDMETSWRPDSVPSPEARYVQVDIDAAEIGRSIPAHLGLVGDIRAVLVDLITALRTRAELGRGSFRDHPRTHAVAAEVREIESDLELVGEDDKPIHPLRVMRALRAAFPRETTLAFDVGVISQHIAGGTPFFKVFEPRSMIVPSSFYGMGFAASALPVACLVYPGRPALGLVGDGSFQMIMHVLPVAAEHHLPVTWCVFNDRALGSIRDIQQYAFRERIIGTEFQVQPDFARIAEACGCYGERVEDPGDVEAAVGRALDANRSGLPAVLDMIVAPARLLQTLEHFTCYPEELIQQYRTRSGAAASTAMVSR